MSSATWPSHPQSLARGDLGAALTLAIEAHADPAARRKLHHHLNRLGPVVDGEDAGLFYGAPALAFVLHMAQGAYQNAIKHLDEVNERVTRTRLAAAHRRIDRGELAAFTEYDVFRGLAGLALLWLQRGSRPTLLEEILTYLVRLTQPAADGQTGWRVWHRRDAFTTFGPHTNNGLAHGICGPLAVLALAWIKGIKVTGHEDAIARIMEHLDAVQQTNGVTCWWDRWDTECRTSPPPLSWCYGTPGIARAQQLAGLALDDCGRRSTVEQAILQQISAPNPAGTGGSTICHGTAGVLRACEHIAHDAANPDLFRDHIDALRSRLAVLPVPAVPGLIDGSAGVRLATQGKALPWDACLALV
ncbi:lanthionine synthetase C family protein [Kineosporia babensis]|uniref:Lanthionine synthetase C family protein n=1 Tax=Kineosporia babensis TaxID=499548 RepID=A0A9X1T4N1_9ACTN|nr:lanthionine synthetase C family protein [Kineosporia babensis]MCD5316828.1 lanthionine synthetase C family protein [Kineosporia babensis]